MCVMVSSPSGDTCIILQNPRTFPIMSPVQSKGKISLTSINNVNGNGNQMCPLPHKQLWLDNYESGQNLETAFDTFARGNQW